MLEVKVNFFCKQKKSTKFRNDCEKLVINIRNKKYRYIFSGN